MIQQRLTERLTRYWELLRKDRIFPDITEVKIGAVEDVWAGCIVVEIQPTVAGKEPKFKYQEVGSLARNLFGSDPTHSYFTSTTRLYPAMRIMRKLPDVIQFPQPLLDEGQFVGENNKIIKFRSCLLPFGRYGEVTHIVAGLSWREF